MRGCMWHVVGGCGCMRHAGVACGIRKVPAFSVQQPVAYKKNKQRGLASGFRFRLATPATSSPPAERAGPPMDCIPHWHWLLAALRRIPWLLAHNTRHYWVLHFLLRLWPGCKGG